jgi:hypothetical protein
MCKRYHGMTAIIPYLKSSHQYRIVLEIDSNAWELPDIHEWNSRGIKGITPWRSLRFESSWNWIMRKPNAWRCFLYTQHFSFFCVVKLVLLSPLHVKGSVACRKLLLHTDMSGTELFPLQITSWRQGMCVQVDKEQFLGIALESYCSCLLTGNKYNLRVVQYLQLPLSWSTYSAFHWVHHFSHLYVSLQEGRTWEQASLAKSSTLWGKVGWGLWQKCGLGCEQCVTLLSLCVNFSRCSGLCPCGSIYSQTKRL